MQGNARGGLIHRVPVTLLGVAAITGAVGMTYGLLRIFPTGGAAPPSSPEDKPISAGEWANGKIAFVRERSMPVIPPIPPAAVYVINGDGTAETLVAKDAGADLAWSPDGLKLAFASGDIFVMNADGTGRRRVTNNVQLEGSPTWSPDGTWIAFSRQAAPPAGDAEIFIINADGSGEKQITDNSSDDFGPEWSPDGSRIALSRWAEGGYGYMTTL